MAKAKYIATVEVDFDLAEGIIPEVTTTILACDKELRTAMQDALSLQIAVPGSGVQFEGWRLLALRAKDGAAMIDTTPASVWACDNECPDVETFMRLIPDPPDLDPGAHRNVYAAYQRRHLSACQMCRSHAKSVIGASLDDFNY